jgi:hypothetical protein
MILNVCGTMRNSWIMLERYRDTWTLGAVNRIFKILRNSNLLKLKQQANLQDLAQTWNKVKHKTCKMPTILNSSHCHKPIYTLERLRHVTSKGCMIAFSFTGGEAGTQQGCTHQLLVTFRLYVLRQYLG